MHLLARWLVNAGALFIAAWLVQGIRLGAAGRAPAGSDWVTLGVVALIFGVINAVIRPIVIFLSLPLEILTLGLFTFVINALMLLLTSGIVQRLQLGFLVDGFRPAFVGALVGSVVRFLLSRLFLARLRPRPRRTDIPSPTRQEELCTCPDVCVRWRQGWSSGVCCSAAAR